MYFDYAERLAESAYENSSSLTPAAETLGLRVESTDWITRNGALPDGLGSPKVLAAAFADDVLQEGHNSELIEIGSQKAVVLRVAEHEPAGVKGFDENREAIEQDYRTEKASEAAAAEGRQVLADLRAGKTTLEQLASEHGWELKPPFEVGREQADAPAEVRVEAFDLAPPGDGASAYAGVVSAEGDFIVLAVSKVEYGTLEALSETERSLFTRKSTSESAGAQMRYLTQNLRERASIELKAVTE